jgi:hypothetical protein
MFSQALSCRWEYTAFTDDSECFSLWAGNVVAGSGE